MLVIQTDTQEHHNGTYLPWLKCLGGAKQYVSLEQVCEGKDNYNAYRRKSNFLHAASLNDNEEWKDCHSDAQESASA